MTRQEVSLKRLMRPVSISTNLIKGEVSRSCEEGLVPGYSASGQDVWLGPSQAKMSGAALVLSAVGARCGKVFKANHPQWGVVANTAVFRVAETCDFRFAWYLTNSESFWEKGGSAQPYVRTDETLRKRINLPSLEEQRRIADFLDAETGRISHLAALRRQVRALLVLRRDLIIEAELGLGSNRESSPTAPLGYLAREIVVGIVITPSAWYVENCGVRALRGLNVRPGRIETSSLIEISREGHALHKKSRLASGDIVVVRTGQAGAAAIVPKELDGANCIDLVIIRPGPRFNSRYLEYLLNSAHARRVVQEYSVGSIQSHFNVGAMKRMPVPVIDVDTQSTIVDRLDAKISLVDDLIENIETQERALAERRGALITAAVTGHVDVTTARGIGA